MTPKEILDDFVKDLNWDVAEVPYHNPGDVCFKHYLPGMVVTKTYYDEGCAAYKLMKYLGRVKRDDKEFRWRCLPEIEQDKDFDQLQMQYRGYARFYVF